MVGRAGQDRGHIVMLGPEPEHGDHWSDVEVEAGVAVELALVLPILDHLDVQEQVDRPIENLGQLGGPGSSISIPARAVETWLWGERAQG